MNKKKFYVVYVHKGTPFHIFVEEENAKAAMARAEEYLMSELNDASVEVLGAYEYDEYEKAVVIPDTTSIDEFCTILKSAAGNCRDASVSFYAEGGGVGACAAGAYITVYCNGKEVVTFASPKKVIMY